MYCPAEAAADLIAISEALGVEARIIGCVEKSDAGVNRVTIKAPTGSVFEY